MHAGQTLTVDAVAGVLANDSDADGDPLTVEAYSTGNHGGTLTMTTDGSFTYMSAAGFVGTETFTVWVTDGIALPVTSALSINVTNQVPTVAADNYSVHAGQTLTVDAAAGVLANDSDADGDPLTAEAYSRGNNGGMLTMALDGGFTYEAASGFVGTETFSVWVTDGITAPVAEALSIHVTNQAPTLTDDSYTVTHDQTLIVNAAAGVLANDSDPEGDAIQVAAISSGSAGGSLAMDPDGGFSYTAATGFVGSETFTVTVVDSLGAASNETLTFNVANHAPTVGDDTYTAHPGQTLTVNAANGVLANDADPEGDAIQVAAISSGSAGGSLTMDPDGSFTYTAAAGFVGSENFTLTVADSLGATSSETLAINVVNVPPTLQLSGSANVREFQNYALTLTTVDAGSDSFSHWTIQWGDGTTETLTAAVTTANHVYTLAGDYHIVATAVGQHDTYTASLTAGILPDYLHVTQFTSNDSGFAVRFNRAIDRSDINLYDAADYGYGAPDVSLTDSSGKRISGSIVLDADARGFTFLKTGGPLAAGSYSVRLESRADAFTDTQRRRLDGNNDGSNGDAYTTIFTVASSVTSATLLSIGEIARGPGQALYLPTTSTHLPITISNGLGATQVSFTLDYDPGLLNITDLTSTLGTYSLKDLSQPGRVQATLNLTSALTTNSATALVKLVATVPLTASYGAENLLHLSNVTVSTATTNLPVRSDDGLHVVAYVGDTTGNAAYNTFDAQKLQRVLNNLDSGFGAYPTVDPTVIGNVTASGSLTSMDSARLLQKIGGISRVEFLAMPSGIGPSNISGADSVLYLGTVSAADGGSVTVPVMVDDAAGIESLQLVINYPSSQLTLTSVSLGGLAADFGYFVRDTGTAGVIKVDMARLNALSASSIQTTGSNHLLELNFTVKAGVTGQVNIDLATATINDAALTVYPAPAVGGTLPGGATDMTDGHICVATPLPTLNLSTTIGDFAINTSGNAGWLESLLSDNGYPVKAKKLAGLRLVAPRV